MDIFNLHQQIINDYRQYVHSFLQFKNERIKQFASQKLIDEKTLWPDALLQLNPAYEKTRTIAQLVQDGRLHPECVRIFRNKHNQSFHLYRHQAEAIEIARRAEPYVVTSGTGSGKTMTYFIPIFDAILKSNPAESKVRAIVVYPMNALVNSQENALNELARQYKQSTGQEMPVRFARYTGQESDEVKRHLRQDPPHILLTNYVMLELMLLRPRENRLVGKNNANLQFLVLDELHTYRGRQGADVALLIRRLKEHTGSENLLTVGTSATMATGNTRDERRKAVAAFASKLFGTVVSPENVIEESLRRLLPVPQPGNTGALRQAVLDPLPSAEWEAFSQNPLSIWIENRFGIREEEGRLRRQHPISLQEGAQKLAKETGVAVETCQKRLQEMLLLGTQVLSLDGSPVFAFKLHQFISQGGSIYATLEPEDKRLLTLQGQYYAPGEEKRLLYPLVFCRVCGQEYYTVRQSGDGRFLYPGSLQMNELFDEDELESSQTGYLMPDPNRRFTDELENLPEHWLTKSGRIKKEYRLHQPQLLHVHANGETAVTPQPSALPGWFQPEPFMLCLNCGEAYTRRDKNDFRKLARLSSEGRSTATTLLSLTAVSAMRQTDLDPEAQKILSFTDNRQDASLQAGHFNDFVQVALIRAALYQALARRSPLKFEHIASQVISVMGLSLDDIARQPHLDPASKQARETQAAFHDLIEYRLYEDLRRGWRLVQPNLEQCGLLNIAYSGLADLVQRNDIWQNVPFMNQLPPERRVTILETILDEMRRQLAIDVDSLKSEWQDELRRRAAEYLKSQWALDESERLRYAGMFIRPGETRTSGDFSLSTQSVIGRWLKGEIKQILGEEPEPELYNQVINGILDGLLQFGIVIEQTEKMKGNKRRGVRLRPSAILWQQGTGQPKQTLLRRYRATGDNFQPVEQPANRYFHDFYSNPQTLAALQKMEAAEHTAQIGVPDRIEREDRFRQGDLSTLFCSPTMELGVDIADLNAVHLRNIPPTPANYAQRSGRSGRAGQPALVLAYCSTGSGHDQYYFRKRDKMVAGAVTPPRIELNNADLITSHMHAIWLTQTGINLGHSMLDIIDTISSDYALLSNVEKQITLPPDKKADCLAICRRVLAACNLDETQADWLYDGWLENLIDNAPQTFDRALDRWREEFRLAWKQLLEAQQLKQNALLLRGTESKEASRQADLLEREAQRQIKLLRCQNGSYDESDFYPYRYLAAEGFLPGYNFPALPVRAFLTQSRGDGEYIARPRFLALSEFGPNNVIYHNGAKYQITKARLPLQEPEKRFTRAKLCQNCGYFHEGDTAHLDLCEQCGSHITAGNGRYLEHLLEMPTAAAIRRERITCDEEERLRRGFDIQTYFRFSQVQNRLRRQQAAVTPPEGDDTLLALTYAPAAHLWRINHRWKRQLEDVGYRLDVKTGQWVNQTVLPPDNGQPQETTSNVRLLVRDNANALLLRPFTDNANESFLASLQYALVKAIQEIYQVEESELASERIGQDEQRSILVWEASEGSLGVLRRLVEEQTAISRIARHALTLLHFDETGRDLRPGQDEQNGCARACYDCLLSYYNQIDHWRLNRHLIRDYLLTLAQGSTQAGSGERDYGAHYQYLRSQTDPASDLEREFLDYLVQTGRRLPDAAQVQLADAHSQPDFFYEPNICVFCDGSVHDKPQQKALDAKIRQDLRGLGYRVIVYRYDDDLEALCQQYPDVFG
ncbi:MAG: DEAD/DEAH box helicase [Candidatus Promineifilaceae bacterium]